MKLPYNGELSRTSDRDDYRLVLLKKILENTIQSFPKVSGGNMQFSRDAGTAMNEAEIIVKKSYDRKRFKKKEGNI